jgi:hypothetical protein
MCTDKIESQAQSGITRVAHKITAAEDSMAVARPVLLFLIGQQVALNFASLWFQNGIWYAQRFNFQMDFFDFCRGAEQLLVTGNPWASDRFVTPPASAFLALPFVGLGWPYAGGAFFLVDFGMVVLALALTIEAFGLTKRQAWMLLGAAGMFEPVYFLIERGNIDGIVMLLAALAVRYATKRRAAACIVAAASIKIYPAVLLGGLLARRDWRLLCWASLAVAVVTLPMGGLWLTYIGVIGTRGSYIRFTENVSILALPMEILPPAAAWTTWTAFVTWALAIQILVDWRLSSQIVIPREASIRLALLVPLFLSLPLTVYPYTAVSLLIVLGAAIALAKDGRLTAAARALIVIGFCLAGFHATAWAGLFDPRAQPTATSAAGFHAVPPLGSILILIGATLAKWGMGINAPLYRGEPARA